MEVKGKRVFVGLSGGVDSAVSAALLQQAGAEVTGVFLKGWYPPGMPCTWADERRDAMRVAAHLRIPFVTLDASADYRKWVIDYLVAEYRAGRTPNPDVMCNREIKFGVFYRYAKARGADAIATGHYRGGEKDQSYFLWAVPKEVLVATLFPVGEMKKDEVRALAKKFGLPVAQKRDSQGICFLGDVSVEDFLKKEFGTKRGSVVDEAGNDIGMHDGVLLYTLGARLPLNDGPWYVVRKDLSSNTLVAAKTRVATSKDASFVFKSANWLGDPSNATEMQYRYRGERLRGHVEGSTFIPAQPPSEPVAPGQSLVFYVDGKLVGGGIMAG